MLLPLIFESCTHMWALLPGLGPRVTSSFILQDSLGCSRVWEQMISKRCSHSVSHIVGLLCLGIKLKHDVSIVIPIALQVAKLQPLHCASFQNILSYFGRSVSRSVPQTTAVAVVGRHWPHTWCSVSVCAQGYACVSMFHRTASPIQNHYSYDYMLIKIEDGAWP